MAEIISLADYRPVGNGAKEALMEVVTKAPDQIMDKEEPSAAADWILAMLWYHGFKVVPLDGEE